MNLDDMMRPPKIPPLPTAVAARQQMDAARSLHGRIMALIRDFEARLDPSQEIGGVIVSGAFTGPFHIDEFGYSNPDLLTFKGTKDGNPVQLLQHHTQVNIELVALPARSDPPRRIGFPVTGE